MQGQADRQAGGAEDGDKARRLHAELVEHGDDDENQDDVADKAGEEGAEGRIDLVGSAQHAPHGTLGPAGNHPTEDENEDAADDAHAIGGERVDHRADQRIEVALVQQIVCIHASPFLSVTAPVAAMALAADRPLVPTVF